MITKELFLKYYAVQMEGKYNMVMEMFDVMKILGITDMQEYLDILRNYNTYYKQYIENDNDVHNPTCLDKFIKTRI